MRLYILRHACPANDPDAVTDDDAQAVFAAYDDDPPLTEEGRKIVEALADWIEENGETPAVLFASPMQRTQETAEILRDKLGILPRVITELSIGPHCSIRGLVKRVTADESMKRVGMVTHHATIENGLGQLNADPVMRHHDQFAQGEFRVYKTDRDKINLVEQTRVHPSDLGFIDRY